MKRITVLLLLATLALNVFSCEPNSRVVDHKECCSITVLYFPNTHNYVVTWVDHLTGEHYDELVEVEYPTEGLSPSEDLELELDWTVAEFKDLHWTQHLYFKD